VSPPPTVARLLGIASELVQRAEVRAHLVADARQAERLHATVTVLDHDAAYARGRDLLGLARVARRRGPPGRTVGWYFAHDAHVRALRQARGLFIPEA
jgi:hypothetical protein